MEDNYWFVKCKQQKKIVKLKEVWSFLLTTWAILEDMIDYECKFRARLLRIESNNTEHLCVHCSAPL